MSAAIWPENGTRSLCLLRWWSHRFWAADQLGCNATAHASVMKPFNLETAASVTQLYDFSKSSTVFDIHPTGESLHSLSLPLKRHGGVATFAKDYGH